MEAVNPTTLSRRLLAAARVILAAPEGVVRVDPDHYQVAGARPGAKAVMVYRRGQGWRCQSDRRRNHADPCAHILAVLEVVGVVRLPATVSPRAEAARRDALEAEAARLLPDRLPVLLARMLDASPAAAPPATARGRPRCSLYAVAYQAIMRAATRRSLRSSSTPGPYRPVSRNTIQRFLADPTTAAFLRGLMEWALAAARPQEATRPEACHRGALAFTTPAGPVVLGVAWTPTYGLVAHLDAATERPEATGETAPGAAEAAARFAALVGGDLASRHPTAQANEARCAALAYNLARLVVVDLERMAGEPHLARFRRGVDADDRRRLGAGGTGEGGGG